jgi:replicative DNA helicase
MNTRPSCSIEAEQATLGSMMIDESWKALAIATRILQAGDFYRMAHQEIFDALASLKKRDEPADMITLQEELKTRKKLVDCGGTEYLMSLVDSVPTAANVEHYAHVVKRHSSIRKLALKTDELSHKIGNPDVDPKALMNWIRSEVDQLSLDEKRGLIPMGDLQLSYWDVLELRKKLADQHGWKFGLPTLDTSFGGCHNAQMIVLKGNRGSGKTHFAIHSTMRCVSSGRAAAFFSMEMSTHQLMDRITAYVSGVDSLDLRKMRDELWEPVAKAMSSIGSLPVFIDDETGLTVTEMRTECEILQTQGIDLGLVVIDFAELIGGPSMGSREQELSTIARGLRQMSKALNCTVMLLSQVNSQGGERWSQAIGNVADLILHWKKEDNLLHVEKNRFGPEPVITCGIDKRTSCIWEKDARDESSAGRTPESFHKFMPWG